MMRQLFLAAVGAVAMGLASSVAVHAQAAPTPACALLSVSDVRTITGLKNYPDHVDGDAEGEGAGGGSSCQYGGSSFMPGGSTPMVSVVFIKGRNWTEQSRGFKLPEGCKREPVAGVGQAAFFEACPATRSKRSAPLYAKVGANDLIIQMDVEPPATESSVRLVIIALAKAAALKAR